MMITIRKMIRPCRAFWETSLPQLAPTDCGLTSSGLASPNLCWTVSCTFVTWAEVRLSVCTRQPVPVFWTMGSSLTTPESSTADRASDVVVPGLLGNWKTVPPLNSTPKFRPRVSSETTLMTRMRPEMEYQSFCRPTKLREISSVELTADVAQA